MIGADVCLAHEVYVTALELGVEDGEIGDVFEDQPLDVGAITEIIRVGDKLDTVARNARAPLECTGTDWRLVEGGIVWISLLLQDVLRHNEGFGQERQVRCERLLHPPCNLDRRDHGDVAHQRVPRCTPTAEVRLHDEFEGEFHVLSRERPSVVPTDILAQADPPFETVLRYAAVLLGRHFNGQVRLNYALGIDAKERVENREMRAVVDLHMRHKRIKDRGFLREPYDNPALGISWSLLAEGG